MNVRGRVASVVDLGLLLGWPAVGMGAAAERILILEPRRRDIGLWVSEVVSIGNLEAPGETASPEVHRADVEPLDWKSIWGCIERL
jgi:chemotaxis signal transduction protein